MSFSERIREAIIKSAVSGKLTKKYPNDSNINKCINASVYESDDCSFLNGESLPEHWSVFRLKDLVELISGVDLPKSQLNVRSLGVPYITGASNIRNGKIELDRWTENPSRKTKSNDLLIVCKGSVGKMAFCPCDDCHIARQLMAIRPICTSVNIKYLKIVLDLFVDYIRSEARSIIPGIDRKTILSLLIPIPSIEEQQRIVDRVNELMAIVDELDKIEKELDQLYN